MASRNGYDGESIQCAEFSMSKTFRPYDPDQQLLLPSALQEWLPPDHLAYFISDIVDHLEALGNLFLQVLALCRRAGLVKLGHATLDRTKSRPTHRGTRQ